MKKNFLNNNNLEEVKENQENTDDIIEMEKKESEDEKDTEANINDQILKDVVVNKEESERGIISKFTDFNNRIDRIKNKKWRKIGLTRELQKYWEEKGFNYEQCKEWIDAGLKTDDYNHAKKWEELDFTTQQTKKWIEVGLTTNDYEFATWLRDRHSYDGVEGKINKEREKYNGITENAKWLESQEEYNKEQKRVRTTKLDVANNDLKGYFDLREFINLEELDCSGNQLTELDLSNCKNLKKLNLSNNEFSDSFLSSFRGIEKLEQLEYLDVSNTGIKSGLEDLPKNIKYFQCQNCPNLEKVLAKYKEEEKYNLQSWQQNSSEAKLFHVVNELAPIQSRLENFSKQWIIDNKKETEEKVWKMRSRVSMRHDYFILILMYYTGFSLLCSPSIDFQQNISDLFKNNYVRASSFFLSCAVFYSPFLYLSNMPNKKSIEKIDKKGIDLLVTNEGLSVFESKNHIIKFYSPMFVISVIAGTFWAITATQSGGIFTANGTICQVMNDKLGEENKILKNQLLMKRQDLSQEFIEDISELENDCQKLLQIARQNCSIDIATESDNTLEKELNNSLDDFLGKISKINDNNSLLYQMKKKILKNIKDNSEKKEESSFFSSSLNDIEKWNEEKTNQVFFSQIFENLEVSWNKDVAEAIKELQEKIKEYRQNFYGVDEKLKQEQEYQIQIEQLPHVVPGSSKK